MGEGLVGMGRGQHWGGGQGDLLMDREGQTDRLTQRQPREDLPQSPTIIQLTQWSPPSGSCPSLPLGTSLSAC